MENLVEEFKCDCGVVATHWSRWSKYIHNDQEWAYERKLENSKWIDPMLEKYWNGAFPEGMNVSWHSKFYCPQHLTINAVQLNG